MADLARAKEIKHELTRHLDLLRGWEIDVKLGKLPVSETESSVGGWVEYEPGYRIATIWIDTGFPAWNEILELDKLVAHEVGHVCLAASGAPKAVSNDDDAASGIGGLLLQWAAERANCKCGEKA